MPSLEACMRVVIVSDFGSVNGGAAKVAIESARGLAEAGVQVVFACAIGPVSERLNHPNLIVAPFAGKDVWSVGSKLAAVRQGVWNGAAHAFLKNLFAAQPDGTLIHLHQWTKAFSPAAVAAAGESGRSVFITMHDYFSFCPVGGYFDFAAGKPCARKPMSVSCITRNCDRASYAHKLVRVARQWRSDRALAACRDLTFLHVSDFARRFAVPFLPAHAKHATVENMMEAEKRAPVDVVRNRHALFLGRLTEEKGVLLLAEAAKRAEIPVRFVGEGPMAAEIARINPAAELVGWVPAEKVGAEIAQARVLVAPSLWLETGPMTVCEAAALGVPAIVSDRMGAADWVQDGFSGRIVAQGDANALKSALCEAKTAAAEWGDTSYRTYWDKPFSLQKHVGSLISAYSGANAAKRSSLISRLCMD
jgi:glycosyltransferase involved in cell wall biosynthesis